MKTFIVYENMWGPERLLGDTCGGGLPGKMCCLGFAAEQCGVSRNALTAVGMPKGVDMNARTPEFKVWKRAMDKKASLVLQTEIIGAINAIPNGKNGEVAPRWHPRSLKSINELMAKVNDIALERSGTVPRFSRHVAKRLIRKGFAEAGYKIVFKPLSPTPAPLGGM